MRPRTLRKSRVSTAEYIDRVSTLAGALASETKARKTWENIASDANRAACRAMDNEREARQAQRHVEAEVEWLYDALRIASQAAVETGDHNALRIRVNQLAARRHPEGRQYEGPGW